MRSRIERLLRKLRTGGIPEICRAARQRLRTRRPAGYAPCRGFFQDKEVLEIGGPSPLFSARGQFPLYPCVARLDNCNFAAQTLWENSLQDGVSHGFATGGTPGLQFLREASDLRGLADGTYGGVISSHTLEHLADPLAALLEWRRVLRPDGGLLLVLPDPRHTFDWRRPVTPMAHLLEDWEAKRAEDDLTHLPEILALHDLRRDSGARDAAEFHRRCLENAQHRCLHHHVFSLELLAEVLAWAGFSVRSLEAAAPWHLFAFAVKASRLEEPR